MTDARAVFHRFRAMPRSEQIATEFALDGIMKWARRRSQGRALDLGAGLGTVSAAIDAVDQWREIATVERDETFRARAGWCTTLVCSGDAPPPTLRALDFASLREALSFGPFGLVVLDDAADTYDLGTLAMKGLAPRAAVVFEGNRPCERGALMAMLAHVHRPHCPAEWKPADRAKGYHVVLCDPRWWERAWFLGVRLRERARDGLAQMRGVRPGWRRRDVDPAG